MPIRPVTHNHLRTPFRAGIGCHFRVKLPGKPGNQITAHSVHRGLGRIKASTVIGNTENPFAPLLFENHMDGSGAPVRESMAIRIGNGFKNDQGQWNRPIDMFFELLRITVEHHVPSSGKIASDLLTQFREQGLHIDQALFRSCPRVIGKPLDKPERRNAGAGLVEYDPSLGVRKAGRLEAKKTKDHLEVVLDPVIHLSRHCPCLDRGLFEFGVALSDRVGHSVEIVTEFADLPRRSLKTLPVTSIISGGKLTSQCTKTPKPANHESMNADPHGKRGKGEREKGEQEIRPQLVTCKTCQRALRFCIDDVQFPPEDWRRRVQPSVIVPIGKRCRPRKGSVQIHALERKAFCGNQNPPFPVGQSRNRVA
jgi:hypothetical protein